MALAILDGTQTATTLSTILSSGQHITAHTVVSLGTQAKTDILSAVSSGIAISGTVTAMGMDYAGTLIQIPVETDTNSIGDKFIPIGFNNDGDARQVSFVYPLPSAIYGIDGAQVKQPIKTALIGSDDLVGGYRLAVGLANNIGYEFGSSFENPVVAGGYSSVCGVSKAFAVTTLGHQVVTISNFPATQVISGTVTANVGNYSTFFGDGYPSLVSFIGDGQLEVGVSNFPATQAISGTVTVGNSVAISSLPAISGTVTANLFGKTTANAPRQLLTDEDGVLYITPNVASLPIVGTVTANLGSALPAGTAQIGSVTASISNSVTIASLPAISGTVTANLSISATAITSGSFASLTSATLVPGNVARKMATVYNLGAGQLFVNAGASATTLGGGFMVALSSGDFYECNYTTTTLSAIFATAGTASWVSH